MPLNLKFLKSVKEDKGKSYLYGDLRLDIQLSSSGGDRIYDTGLKKDVQIDYDLSAIKNSIYNAFNTKPGQLILHPEYGLDLSQFLFEPINEMTANEIGQKILSLQQLEPRIRINNLNIKGIQRENMYNIYLSIIIPAFQNFNTTLSGQLNQKGFTFN
jgi:uncharacterized protein